MNELLELIRRTENHNNSHNLVVDYDGEVLIDPQILQPELEVSKFKVLLRLSDPSMKMIGDKKSCLQNLLNIILKAWYNGEAGIHTSISAHSGRTQATGKKNKKTLPFIN